MRKYLVIAIIFVIFLSGCTTIDDIAKDFESDTDGLERTITIYSKTGEILKQYQGKSVRTKYNEKGGVLVINIDGKRIQVMNSDVVIEEKGSEKYEL